LQEAITRSLNTTFYGLAYEVGPENVAETARKAAGMPDVWEEGNRLLLGKPTLANPETGAVGSSIGIGEYEMRPIDQAHGFATFAAGGVERKPFFVARVSNTDGATLLEYGGEPGEQVFTPEVADDVSFALKGVASYSKRALEGGREVASKTGTVGSSDQDNSDAWMVGYTPSLSTAVWMGNDDPNVPIVNANGGIVYGSGLPGAIWQRFMNAVLAGTPKEDLPDRPSIQGDTGEGVPEPAPTPVRTTEAPVPTPTPTPTPAVESPVPPVPPVTPPGGEVDGENGDGRPAQGVPGIPGEAGRPEAAQDPDGG
jgi:membrane peptidoglycan carboxypeptidase